jgi:Ser/Thr protein kinase RdoA (MazF antagonist)
VTPDPLDVVATFALPGEVLAYEPVAGGWSNDLLRLRTTAGEWAVKVVRNPWGEPRWLEWLAEGWRLERAALGAGVRAPEPVLVDGWPVALVPVAAEESVPVRVHVWADGAVVPREPVDPVLARWVGVTLAHVHDLALEPLQPGLFADRAGLTTAELWPDLLLRSAGTSWAAELAAAEPFAQRASGLLRPWDPADAVLVHGDLHQRNLLLASDGPLLLDWDVVVPLPPTHDLAHAALTMAAWRDPMVAREVLAGYAAVAGERPALSRYDLGPALASRLGWIRFRVDRALEGDAEAAATIVPALHDLRHRVDVAERLPEWLQA